MTQTKKHQPNISTHDIKSSLNSINANLTRYTFNLINEKYLRKWKCYKHIKNKNTLKNNHHNNQYSKHKHKQKYSNHKQTFKHNYQHYRNSKNRKSKESFWRPNKLFQQVVTLKRSWLHFQQFYSQHHLFDDALKNHC